MTAYTDRICAALESLLRERTEWDEAPDLHFMYAEGSRIRLSRPEALVPRFVWAGEAPPTYKLAALADALIEMLPPDVMLAITPRALVGVVFRFETWSVRVPNSADRAAQKYATAMHSDRMLHEHPDRVESRMAWAVTREGGHWTATQERGSDVIRTGRAPLARGLVPESLEKIISAMSAGLN